MKILYNKIKEFLPDLEADYKEVSEVLTMTGFMCDSLEEIEFNGKKDYLIGLEVRQNRADCNSYLGIARELSAYYNLELKLPELRTNFLENSRSLDINIEAVQYVKRVVAIQIDNLINKESPDWLKEFLSIYELNSVNLLVDLSNYVMITTGYTSHLLDKDKIRGKIAWCINDNFNTITTLDGTEIKLQRKELIIKDEKNILALAGIVGAREAEISLETKNIIIEMAVYDRFIIRQNCRSLSILTEAGNRVSKDSDPEGIDYAFNLLVDLILENLGGEVNSNKFDYYSEKNEPKIIELKVSKPSKFAGIEISEEDVIRILKSLRCEITGFGDDPDHLIIKVKVPTDRVDLSLEEDLIEEVIRFIRYDSIPYDEIPKLEVVNDITPKIYLLKDKIKNILTNFGFDEILSKPLVAINSNKEANYLDWEPITTQNSVNEEFPDLRQSIAIGLIDQFKEYLKKNVEYINIFEIGKVFGKLNEKYKEHDSLGVLLTKNSPEISFFNEAKYILESLLRLLGLTDVIYKQAKIKPEVASPYSAYDVFVSQQHLGVIYQLKPIDNNSLGFFEVNLEILLNLLLAKEKNNVVVEITKKIVILDANVELGEDENIFDYIEEIENKIDKNNIWAIRVTDKFKKDNKIKYTIRVSYKELSDQEAKKIHLEAFNLN